MSTFKAKNVKNGTVKAGSRNWMVPARPARLLRSWLLATVSLPALAGGALALPPSALPTNGQIVAGSATIGGTGNHLDITQSTNRTIIDWGSFNIGSAASVTFHQPNSGSVALNRVLIGDASQIDGHLSANGQVFLINTAGVIFGAGAHVDVGGLVASVMDIKNADFMAGKYSFTRGQATGAVLVQGTINANPGGYVALLAPELRNQGVITGQFGTVVLASGDAVTLTVASPGHLTVTVDPATVKSLIDNRGLIAAEDGSVLLSAKAANTLLGGAINNGGVIEADSFVSQGGQVVLTASGALTDSGRISAQGATAGGSVSLQGGTVTLTGATVDASGASGGGTILAGSWGTQALSADAATVLDASARLRGNGGTIRALSGGATIFSGTVTARGGALGGDGGTVETSGHVLNIDGVRVDTGAPKGAGGSWLLDPYTLTIDNIAAAAIYTALVSGNVTLTTSATTATTAYGGTAASGSGDIVVDSGISWSTAYSLTLSAYRDIDIFAPIGSSGSGALNLSAGRDILVGSAINGGTGALNVSAYRNVTVANPIYGSGAMILRADNTGTGTGSVSFVGEGLVLDALGSVSIYYNPNSYTSPTDYALDVMSENLTAYMLVNNYANLQAINTNLSGTYALGANINACNCGGGFTPIGFIGIPFTGLFEGDGHKIKGLTIGGNIPFYVGLFGDIGPTGVVRDVGLVGGSVTGWSYVGALAGENDGTISNSYATSSVSGRDMVGGLVGLNAGTGTILSSYATGSVSGAGGDSVGGLVGQNDGTVLSSSATGSVSSGISNSVGGLVGLNTGTISKSFATGSVSGYLNIGGLVGENDGSVSNSYATGSVSGLDDIGGLVGHNQGTISFTYATGAVSGDIVVAGLVGFNDVGGTVLSSFWDITTSGTNNGIFGITTTGATGLHDSGTVTNAYARATYSGWNFTSGTGTWFMIDGWTRPFLQMEYSTTIGNAHQLQLMAMNLSATYTLGANIDLTNSWSASGMWSSAGFAPIGNSETSFTGIFDGAGHTITDLVINQPSTNDVGLFGKIGAAGVVSNVGLVGGSVTGLNYVGELAGQNYGMVSSSYATGSVSAVGGFVGGLAGQNYGTILSSYATGGVTGGDSSRDLGGLVGTNLGIISSGSYATGSVIGGSGAYNIGGLVGDNEGTILSSHATGSVSGGTNAQYIGGLAGYNGGTIGSSDVSVPPSYATGSVSGGSGASYIGGLVGDNDGGTILSSYATGTVSAGDGTSYIGGLAGYSDSTILSSYATGTVSAGSGASYLGGLLGYNDGMVSASYATGSVSGGSGAYDVGGLVGYSDSTILSSYATGSVSGTHEIGGLVGYNDASLISASYATGRVSGTLHIGGLVGWNSGTVLASHATGAVSGGSGASDIGGLMGYNNASGTVLSSYATGAVTGGDGAANIGGLVGDNEGTVSTSHATGSVSGGSAAYEIGGLVGYNGDTGTVSVSYATGAVSGGSAAYDIGGLVGNNFGTDPGRILFSYATGAVSGGDGAFDIGGLVGVNGGTVSASYATGSVSGGDGAYNIGGLVGLNNGTVAYSYATGSVSGGSGAYDIGGLAGANGGTVEYAYATGAVSGGIDAGTIGGLVGNNGGLISVTYATGSVSGGDGASTIGGLVGLNDIPGTVSSSFWDTTTSGTSTGISMNKGAGDATGKTTALMRTKSTFTDAGWTFATSPTSGGDWYMIDGSTRPFLASEYSTTITNAHQLQLMAMDLTATYTLGANIDMTGSWAASGMWSSAGFVPVGNSSTVFTGTFDGAGHTITDLVINQPATNYIGLFGDSSGVVRNVGLVGGSITGHRFVGELVGQNSGTVSASYATGAVSGGSGAYDIGGLVGENDGKVLTSYATGPVSAGDGAFGIGGLVGLYTWTGTVSFSYATGAVSGGSGAHYIGGLVGWSQGTVSASFATGSVSGGSGANFLGGLVGINDGPSSEVSSSFATGSVSGGSGAYNIGGLAGRSMGTILSSYATGAVSGGSAAYNIGGLLGYNYGGMVSVSYAAGQVSGGSGAYNIGGLVGNNSFMSHVLSSYWDKGISGLQTIGIGLEGGTTTSTIGLSDANMMKQASFTNLDFETTWLIVEKGSYPMLQWQYPNGIISGTVSTGAPGVVVDVAVNGTLLTAQNTLSAASTLTTNVNGVFWTAPVAGVLTANAAVLDWLDSATGSESGALVQLSNTNTFSGGTLTPGLLTVTATGPVNPSNAILATAKGALSDPSIPYSVSGSTLTLVSGVGMETTSGTTYNLDGAIAGTNATAGITFNGAVVYSVSGSIATTTAGNITFNDTVTGTGSGADLTVNAAGAVSAAQTITGDGNVTLTAGGALSAAQAISGANVTLTGASLTLNGVNAGAGKGNVSLSSTGLAADGGTVGGGIIAGTLDLGGVGGAYTLISTANAVNILTGNTGSVDYVQSGSLIIGSAVSATCGGSAASPGTGLTGSGNITVQSTTGSMTLNNAVTVTGLAANIVLADDTTFTNNAGSSGIVVNTTDGHTGRFLVWSQDPRNDNRGGLGYKFKQYNATYGTTPVADTTSTDSGFLYTVAPTITLGLNAVVKTYDGNTTATFASNNGSFSIAGAIDGDTIHISTPSTGTYGTKNAGSGINVTADGVSVTGATALEGAATVYGYTLPESTTLSDTVGTINKKLLTVTGSKVYTGTTGFTYGQFDVTGAVAGENITPTAGSSNASSANVGTYEEREFAGLAISVSGSNNVAANYTLPELGTMAITKAPLTVKANDFSKLFNGTAYSGGNGVTYSGFVNGETADGVLEGSLGYGGSSQGAINVGTYAITPYGLTSGNYTVTFVNGTLNVTAVLIDTGKVLNLTTIVTPHIVNSVPTPLGGVQVTVAPQLPGSVGNPQVTATVTTPDNFSFRLPETVVPANAANATSSTATMPDNTALPSWLHYDPATATFTAENAPPSGLPLEVTVHIDTGDGGSKSVDVNIAK